MTSPDINEIPDFAINYGSVSELSAKTKTDWESGWVEQIGGVVNIFTVFLNGIESIFESSGLEVETQEAIKDLFDGIVGDFFGSIPFLGDLLKNEDFQSWVATFFTPIKVLIDVLGQAGQAIFSFLGWAWNQAGDIAEDIVGFLAWAWDQVDDVVEALLKPVFGFVAWAWDLVGEIAEDILGFIAWAWDQIDDVVEALLKPVFGFIAWAWDQADDVVEALLKPIINFFSGLIEDFGSIGEWLSGVPIIGDVVQAVTGIVGGGLDDLTDFFRGVAVGGASLLQQVIEAVRDIFLPEGGDLVEWARKILNLDNISEAIEQLFSGVLGTIPVAHVNTDKVNLLNLGNFQTAATLTAADGWSWDSSKNRTQVSGGSAKVTCNGTARVLYSNQSIKVTAGDRLAASAFVNTSGFNGNSTSIQMSIVPFAGTVQKPTVNLCSRGASNNAWGELTNASSPYEIPAAANAADQITSVQVLLAVTSSASTGSVNWDDIWLYKAGVLQQNLVEYLLSAWDNLWNGMTGSTGATGKTWDQLLGAAQAVRTQANNGVTGANTAIGLNNTLSTNLSNAPSSVIGSILGVIIDGISTMGQFLSLLFDGLSGTSGSSGRTAFNVNTAGLGFRGAFNTTNANFSTLNGTLFGQPTPGSAVLPGALPMNSIGATILPGPGSGAMLTRRNTDTADLRSGRQRLDNVWKRIGSTWVDQQTSFFTQLDVASDDIQCLDRTNVARTGIRTDYAGVFRVVNDGWYLCEIGLRNVLNFNGGFRYAAVLYRSNNFPTQPLEVYKVGADALGIPVQSPCRYAQSSFIVYLPSGGAVAAGVDASQDLTNFLSADAAGTETYFSISLLNRSYQ